MNTNSVQFNAPDNLKKIVALAGGNTGGVKAYTSLQAAIDAVEEGETVKLLDDVTISEGANAVGITRGVSFTLDLNGKTLTGITTNAAIRANINNDDVTESVTINIKNGTVTAGPSAYCALIAVGKSEDVTLTVNLDEVALNGSNSDGCVVKVFANAIVNVNDGTVITGADSYGCMEVMGVANIYDGAKLYQKGTTSYNGCIVGVSYGGVANIYDGEGNSTKTGLIVMTSAVLSMSAVVNGLLRRFLPLRTIRAAIPTAAIPSSMFTVVSLLVPSATRPMALAPLARPLFPAAFILLIRPTTSQMVTVPWNMARPMA